MMKFVLGVVVGIAIAVCGYKPYQIEMEYRHNISAPLDNQVDPVVPHPPLRADAKAGPHEPPEHILLELRFRPLALLKHRLEHRFRILGVFDQAAP